MCPAPATNGAKVRAKGHVHVENLENRFHLGKKVGLAGFPATTWVIMRKHYGGTVRF